jgi:hypothetical protein
VVGQPEGSVILRHTQRHGLSAAGNNGRLIGSK